MKDTPAKRVKEASNGALKLVDVSDITKVPVSTLNDWFSNKRIVFEACLMYAILDKV